MPKKTKEWECRKVKLSEIFPNSHNPRKITKEKFERLKKKIEEVGFHSPIKVDNDNVILGGNQRYQALLEMGAGDLEVPVMFPQFKLTEKERQDYFYLDYQKEYGADADEVLIFTNPPFKGLSKILPVIECDYILFGSKAVGLSKNIYAKEALSSLYIKNKDDFTGDAGVYQQKYGRVATFFYSNREFLSAGHQYINKTKNKESLLFGKDRLKQIK